MRSKCGVSTARVEGLTVQRRTVHVVELSMLHTSLLSWMVAVPASESGGLGGVMNRLYRSPKGNGT